MPKQGIKAVIFDVDGLILNTEIHFDTVMEEIAGQPVPAKIRSKMLGRHASESAELFSNFAQSIGVSISGPEYLEKRSSRLNDLFSNSDLMPGAANIIRHFHTNNIPIAIATSSSKDSLDFKTSQHQELFSLFNCVITGDQVSKGKPDPEIFLAAATCLNAPPQNCLVLEDSPSGIKAGINANMHVVAIPHPLLTKDKIPSADQVLSSLQEFNFRRWGLPPL